MGRFFLNWDKFVYAEGMAGTCILESYVSCLSADFISKNLKTTVQISSTTLPTLQAPKYLRQKMENYKLDHVIPSDFHNLTVYFADSGDFQQTITNQSSYEV